MTYKIHVGNNLDILPTLPDNSVDSIVTDPPYGLSDNKYVAETITRWINGERDFIPDGKGFMGKSWDAFVPPPALWDECLRVLKPGGHLLAFFGTRTQDIGALAIRLAGFEIRDSIAWLYGSGFPKSMDISKQIDKAAGAEREVIGTKPQAPKFNLSDKGGTNTGYNKRLEEGAVPEFNITAPSTPEAQQWQGWGTALKPALEPIVVARKPIEGTVAANVLKWGTGGLNIDGSRIGTEQRTNNGMSSLGVMHDDNWQPQEVSSTVQGRWPANIILDPYTAELLDEQSGQSTSKSGTMKVPDIRGGKYGSDYGTREFDSVRGHNDSGGASRFFYVAKASKRDRNEGLEHLADHDWSKDGAAIPQRAERPFIPSKNHHPTVKPTALMEYLVKLVTPPNGTVLDPFLGSGSTGKAAVLNGFNFIGVEMTEEYLPIIEGRLAYAEKVFAEKKDTETEKLF